MTRSMAGGSRRRSRRAGALAAATVLVATGCYQAYDFDNDGKADTVWMTAAGAWQKGGGVSGPSTIATDSSMANGSVAVVGDYDGNGSWEPAVVTSANGVYGSSWVTHGNAGTIAWAPPALAAGEPASLYYQMVPVPGAYDGHHKTEPAWYRDYDGTWFIQGHSPIQFGHGPSDPAGSTTTGSSVDQDVPVPADYDGDGITDLATYGPLTGVWTIRSSRAGTTSTTTLGGLGWLPIPADYHGVGHAQVAAFKLVGQNLWTWRIQGDADVVFGSGCDVMPAPGDYDGDGKAELSYVDDADHACGTTVIWRISPSGTVNLGSASNATVVPAETPPFIWVDLPRFYLLAHNLCGSLSAPTC